LGSASDVGRSLGRLWKSAYRLMRVSDGRGGSRPRPEPACEFGLLVEERLRDLQGDVGDVKRLLRWLLLAVIGALVGLVADLLGAI
jgi:hypothetical protein